MGGILAGVAKFMFAYDLVHNENPVLFTLLFAKASDRQKKAPQSIPAGVRVTAREVCMREEIANEASKHVH